MVKISEHELYKDRYYWQKDTLQQSNKITELEQQRQIRAESKKGENRKFTYE